ncbi:ribosome 60S biogenesis N-terminal, putative [Leishmania tarentolae]|uniref:Ribosome 60S biogenesis N-terminal, putative n=1 Tax=Leishmania tarentolae TaxID=5689 RepID=A0A640KN79_LEITA|nr:ribosome 60S biogenesis N-terminal, putative [Leishmania tarentolae]
MALVEPLVGHLLSKYKETVLEGLAKIRHTLQAGGEEANELAVAVSQREEALQALRATLLRHEYFVPTLQTLTAVLTQLVERGNRVALTRELLRGDCATLFRRTLATLSDATLTHVTAALQFLTVAVKDAPLLVLARLRSPADAHAAPAAASSASMIPLTAVAAQRRADIPLHLAAFRLQLTYNQRRIRLTRLGFLVQLVTSPMHNAVADTICSHGVLTHLLEDAAELLREGTSAGVACALSALRVVRELFVQSLQITAEQKRRVLLAQRNIFRLLVRALEFDPVADNAAAILYDIVDETIESPADYASTRVESLEDQGMPNYLLFFLVRQLRPKASERMSQLVLYILQRAPDLIRPYFIRVSGHLAEEGSSHGVAPSTARVAVLNLMTRTFLCPMPYHLAAQQVQLEPVVAKTSTFYTMCPRDVADEICPAWVAEYVHRLINGSTNLLTLVLAMQLTQAALMRAKRVLPLVLAVQSASRRNNRRCTAGAAAAGGNTGKTAVSLPSPRNFTVEDLDVLRGNETAEAEVWDTYNAQVRHHLQAALPSREEFWHRMTQQLHRTLAASATAPRSSTASLSSTPTDAILEKTHVVVQRMLLLMKNYVDVFDVRVPWLSAVPTFLPDLARSAVRSSGVSHGSVGVKGGNAHATAPAVSVHPITAALQKHNDILKLWPAASVALLCELLAVSQQRRVPMMKMHHINMSQAVGIGEWPLLLSILLWVTHHRQHGPTRQESVEAVQEARTMGWASQLLLWTVHSVTIHFTCTMAETHLWLSCLTPNTVPIFLHVLNHLLMRSLSKVADRVTQELREAQHGVLAAAALHFIDRVKEKQQQKGDASGDKDEGDGAQQQKMSRAECVNNNGGASSSSANLWGTHLQASLSEFEGVVTRVVQLWGRRSSLLAKAAVAMTPEPGVPRVTQQQSIEVLILADRQRGFSTVPLRYKSTSQSAHLRTFAFTLHSPVLPPPEEEAAMGLLSRLNMAVFSASPLDREKRGRATKQAPVNPSLVEDVLMVLGIDDSLATAENATMSQTPPWFVMNSVCWQVAGVLLSRTHSTLSAPSFCSISMAEAAHELALRLARALLSHEAALAAHLKANADREGSLTGLLVVMLVCTRTLLRCTSSARTGQKQPCFSVDECAALGRVCVDVYSGTLSVQDRLLYASLPHPSLPERLLPCCAPFCFYPRLCGGARRRSCSRAATEDAALGSCKASLA